jgi:hypothetical protein
MFHWNWFINVGMGTLVVTGDNFRVISDYYDSS